MPFPFFTRRAAPQPEGRFTRLHDNGVKREEGTWVAGRRHGLWRKWYDNGQLEEECTWV